MFERAQLAAAFGLARWQRGHTLERELSTSRPDRVEVCDLDARQSTPAQRDCDYNCDAHACPVHTLALASEPAAVTHTPGVPCSPCAAADRVPAPTPRARAQASPGCTARPRGGAAPPHPERPVLALVQLDQHCFCAARPSAVRPCTRAGARPGALLPQPRVTPRAKGTRQAGRRRNHVCVVGAWGPVKDSLLYLAR